MRALDLFAGTGWGVACQRLGIEEMGVEIMPEAVATREANGMKTIYNDVWDGLDAPKLAYELLIASPPCQTFSTAGKGAGRKALDDVIEAIATGAYRNPARLRQFGEDHDPRTALVLTPLAHVYRDMPMFVTLEQVPAVLPVWEACADVMRGWGYSVKVANLHAEQYGVPQTRKRAILVARRDGIEVQLPTPTHSKYYSSNPSTLDPGVRPWVSMAEALGWGATDQPSHTVTAGVHGPTDRWASGGNSVRKALDAKIGTAVWIDKPNQMTDARTKYAQRFDVEDVAAIQSYPAVMAGAGTSCQLVDPRPVTSPAQTITGAATAEWGYRTTRAPGPGQRDPDGVRLKPTEAAALQSYERPFVWCGTKTKQFLQIGNAVPPLLAQHVLTALTQVAEIELDAAA